MTRATTTRVQAASIASIVLAAVVAGASVGATADETIAIRGRIVAKEVRRPLARARVVVRDGAGRELHLTTDRDGRYVAIGLMAGPIDVSVADDGFASESQSCRVSSGDTLRLDFQLVDHLSNIGRRIFPCRIEPQSADRYVIE